MPHFRVSETSVRCKYHLTFEKHSRFARNNIYFLPLLLPRWFASQKVTRDTHKDSGRMGSSSRHRARQHVPKHDVQETIENLSHSKPPISTTTETTTNSKSIAGDSKTGETDGTSTSRTMQKQTVMNAIDAFHQNIRNNTTLQTTTDVETSSRSSSEETIRSVGKEMMADDIEAACAPLKRTTERNGERRALVPDARNGQSLPEEEKEKEKVEMNKIKETKRRSERCYGCVSCAHYC